MRFPRCALLCVLFFLFGKATFAQIQTTDFVEVQVSDGEPFVGEQIVYTARWYSTLDSEIADEADIIWPSFEGFGRIDEVYSSTTDRRENTLYSVVVLEVTLLPLRAGQLRIEPFRLDVPPSPFQDEFIIESQPIDVVVRSLPHDQPDTFVNAIGQFSVETSVDKTHVSTHEQFVYTLSLVGMGNLQQIAVPKVNFPESWRVFAVPPRYQTLAAGLMSKQFSWRLEPLEAGNYVLNPTMVTIFDPQQEVYRTLAATPFNIDVASAANNVSTTGELSLYGVDEIARVPTWVPISDKLLLLKVSESPLFWLLWFVPVFVVSVIWSMKFLGRRQPSQNKAVLSRRALRRRIMSVPTEKQRLACEEMLKSLRSSNLRLDQDPWLDLVKQLQEAQFAPITDVAADTYKQQILDLLK